MAKKKTLTEKIVEAVDHVVHPNQSSEKDSSDQTATPVAEPEIENNAGPVKNELDGHPKFAKFKTQGSN